MRHRTVIASISLLLSRITSLRRRRITKTARQQDDPHADARLDQGEGHGGKCAVSHCRNEGISSIIGITAMSWNRRIPMEIFPWALVQLHPVGVHLQDDRGARKGQDEPMKSLPAGKIPRWKEKRR